MKLFISSLSGGVPNVSEGIIGEMTPLTAKIVGGVDTAQTSVYWFKPYLASDFPEITGVTKNYICLYSTDHAQAGAYWGQCDDLELNGFEEKGKMFTDNNSAETVDMYRVGTEVHISYHPNPLPQQTKIITTTGGGLTSIGFSTNGSGMAANGWTFNNNPYGLLTLANGNQIGGYDEEHTGYSVTRQKSDLTYEASHLVLGGDGISTRWRYSTSPDGLVWTRDASGDQVKDLVGFDDYACEPYQSYVVKPSGIYCFGQGTDEILNLPDTRVGYLVKVDSNYRNPIFIKKLDPSLEWRHIRFYEDGNTLHCYISDSKFNTTVYHSTIDISQL